MPKLVTHLKFVRFLPRPPTLAGTMSFYYRFFWYILHIVALLISVACVSALEFHVYLFAGLDILYPLVAHYGIYLMTAFCVFSLALFISAYLPAVPSKCSVATQTAATPWMFSGSSGPSSVFISRAGSCYHVSQRCPENGTHTPIQEFRRCRNCG